MNWIGDYPEDFTTVAVYFTTYNNQGAPVAPSSAYVTSDVKIYKNGSATEKTSTNGLTMTSPFDSIVGLHRLLIDTSNDTGDSGFWTTGGGDAFSVILSSAKTVGGQVSLKEIASFGICLEPALRPTVARRTLDVTATGGAGIDWGNVESPTSSLALTNTTISSSSAPTAAQVATAVWQDTTAGDFTAANSIGKSVMNGVSLGTGLTVNAVTGLTASNLDTTVSSRLAPTVAARTLDVSAGGEAGVDWANVGSPTTVLALTGTTIATTQKVDVETIKTNPVVNGGTLTFPSGATLASTTNITAGTITTVTTVINQLTAAQIATGVWQDATSGDFTTSGSIGKSLFTSGVLPGASGGMFIAGTNAATTITTALTTIFTGNLTGNVGGNVTGSIGSLATQAKADVNAEADTALADYDAPTHTELTAELATADDAVLAQVALVKTQTDKLTFTVPNKLDANILYVNGVAVTGAGTAGNPWGPV